MGVVHSKLCLSLTCQTAVQPSKQPAGSAAAVLCSITQGLNASMSAVVDPGQTTAAAAPEVLLQGTALRAQEGWQSGKVTPPSHGQHLIVMGSLGIPAAHPRPLRERRTADAATETRACGHGTRLKAQLGCVTSATTLLGVGDVSWRPGTILLSGALNCCSARLCGVLSSPATHTKATYMAATDPPPPANSIHHSGGRNPMPPALPSVHPPHPPTTSIHHSGGRNPMPPALPSVHPPPPPTTSIHHSGGRNPMPPALLSVHRTYRALYLPDHPSLVQLRYMWCWSGRVCNPFDEQTLTKVSLTCNPHQLLRVDGRWGLETSVLVTAVRPLTTWQNGSLGNRERGRECYMRNRAVSSTGGGTGCAHTGQERGLPEDGNSSYTDGKKEIPPSSQAHCAARADALGQTNGDRSYTDGKIQTPPSRQPYFAAHADGLEQRNRNRSGADGKIEIPSFRQLHCAARADGLGDTNENTNGTDGRIDVPPPQQPYFAAHADALEHTNENGSGTNGKIETPPSRQPYFAAHADGLEHTGSTQTEYSRWRPPEKSGPARAACREKKKLDLVTGLDLPSTSFARQPLSLHVHAKSALAQRILSCGAPNLLRVYVSRYYKNLSPDEVAAALCKLVELTSPVPINSHYSAQVTNSQDNSQAGTNRALQQPSSRTKKFSHLSGVQKGVVSKESRQEEDVGCELSAPQLHDGGHAVRSDDTLSDTTTRKQAARRSLLVHPGGMEAAGDAVHESLAVLHPGGMEAAGDVVRKSLAVLHPGGMEAAGDVVRKSLAVLHPDSTEAAGDAVHESLPVLRLGSTHAAGDAVHESLAVLHPGGTEAAGDAVHESLAVLHPGGTEAAGDAIHESLAVPHPGGTEATGNAVHEFSALAPPGSTLVTASMRDSPLGMPSTQSQIDFRSITDYEGPISHINDYKGPISSVNGYTDLNSSMNNYKDPIIGFIDYQDLISTKRVDNHKDPTTAANYRGPTSINSVDDCEPELAAPSSSSANAQIGINCSVKGVNDQISAPTAASHTHADTLSHSKRLDMTQTDALQLPGAPRCQNTAEHEWIQHSSAQHEWNQRSSSQHAWNQHSSAQHEWNQRSSAQHEWNQHSSAQHEWNQHSSAQHESKQQSPTQHATLPPAAAPTSPPETTVPRSAVWDDERPITYLHYLTTLMLSFFPAHPPLRARRLHQVGLSHVAALMSAWWQMHYKPSAGRLALLGAFCHDHLRGIPFQQWDVHLVSSLCVLFWRLKLPSDMLFWELTARWVGVHHETVGSGLGLIKLLKVCEALAANGRRVEPLLSSFFDKAEAASYKLSAPFLARIAHLYVLAQWSSPTLPAKLKEAFMRSHIDLSRADRLQLLDNFHRMFMVHPGRVVNHLLDGLRISRLTKSEVLKLLEVLSVMGHQDAKVFEAAATSLHKPVSHGRCSPSQLALLARTFSQVPDPPSSLMWAIAHSAAEQFPDFEVHDVRDMVVALARSGTDHPVLFSRMRSLVVEQVESIPAGALADMLWATVRLARHTKQVLDVAVPVIISRLECLSAEQLVHLAFAYAVGDYAGTLDLNLVADQLLKCGNPQSRDVSSPPLPAVPSNGATGISLTTTMCPVDTQSKAGQHVVKAQSRAVGLYAEHAEHVMHGRVSKTNQATLQAASSAMPLLCSGSGVVQDCGGVEQALTLKAAPAPPPMGDLSDALPAVGTAVVKAFVAGSNMNECMAAPPGMILQSSSSSISSNMNGCVAAPTGMKPLLSSDSDSLGSNMNRSVAAPTDIKSSASSPSVPLVRSLSYQELSMLAVSYAIAGLHHPQLMQAMAERGLQLSASMPCENLTMLLSCFGQLECHHHQLFDVAGRELRSKLQGGLHDLHLQIDREESEQWPEGWEENELNFTGVHMVT